MMNELINEVDAWLDEIIGEAKVEPSAVAERVVSEAVELALACGCGRESIKAAVQWELGKAERRGELDNLVHDFKLMSKQHDELGGLLIQILALAKALPVGFKEALEDAFIDYRKCTWHVDRRGALWSRGPDSGRTARCSG